MLKWIESITVRLPASRCQEFQPNRGDELSCERGIPAEFECGNCCQARCGNCKKSHLILGIFRPVHELVIRKRGFIALIHDLPAYDASRAVIAFARS
jgi:hypothetical protein